MVIAIETRRLAIATVAQLQRPWSLYLYANTMYYRGTACLACRRRKMVSLRPL